MGHNHRGEHPKEIADWNMGASCGLRGTEPDNCQLASPYFAAGYRAGNSYRNTVGDEKARKTDNDLEVDFLMGKVPIFPLK